MEILKNAKQINDRINNLLEKEYFFDNEDKFISSFISLDELKNMIQKSNDFSLKKDEIEHISELVFQLKNYIFAVGNLVKMFLLKNSYDAVYYFVSRTFVAHIGTMNYTSTQGQYTFTERYFDRFIEIMKNCEVDYEIFMPMILDIFKTDKVAGISAWKAPAVEYLQRFFNQNEEWSMKFLKENVQLKYELMKAIAEFNTQKGITLIIDDFSSGDCSNEEQALHIMKKYKRETLFEIDKQLAENDEVRRSQLVKILINFDNDTEVSTRLHELYSQEKNNEIKSLIATKIGITETMSIKTEKQYLLSVRKNIKEPQERSLGIGFDKLHLSYTSGFEVDNAGKTFLIMLFKEEKNLHNIHKLEVLKNIFNAEELENFCYTLFLTLQKKEDILQAKWCLRMICVLCQSKIEEICEICVNLFNQNRNKEAKYLLECLIFAKRQESIEVLKNALQNKNVLMLEVYETLAQSISEVNKLDIDVVLDLCVPDNFDKSDIEKQTKRLYEGFITGRTYSLELFEKIFTKPLFAKLGRNLVFGEYAFSRMYNAFVFDNGKKYFIMGKELDDPNRIISIVHSQDCDERFASIKDYIENPTFDQFAEPRFNVNEFSRASISVNRFCGMFVSLEPFTKKMLEKGFTINKAYDEIEFSSFIHVMPKLNLIAEVMLERPAIEGQESVTIGMVHFVRFEDILCDKGKYITTKENSVSVGSLPSRYFAYIMDCIYESANTTTN